ncbi:Glycosyltransferase [Melia azedarach]|uniref:Glycosyltransferase n=1 Tax=Melia azedarach TaxID=155640 RepID=A0ACC1XXS9_MELAZ|nr:Glycosyltransferase [Melia azedarach]
MVAFSSQGHINPMLRLGKLLVSKGLNVTLASTEIAKHRMLKSFISKNDSSTMNSVSDIPLIFFSDGFDLEYNRGADLDHYMDTLGKVGPVNLSELIRDHYRNNQKKLSCIINNPFVPWVADVAAELGIPSAMLWIQPCSLYAIYYRFSNKLNPFPTLENPDLSVESPGLPILRTEDLPSFVLPSNPFGSLAKLFSDLFQDMKKQYKWILANSFSELEKEVIDSMSELYPIRPVGPLVPPSLLGQDEKLDIGVEMWKAEDSCLEWLNQQTDSSVIYLSFGSMVVLSAKQMEAIATALKNINHPFLWVVKKPEFPTNDEGKVPLGFTEETKNQGLVVSWCPQPKVLAHPALACFITHCGWNSMLETIVAGVPVIAFPQWTDQPTNAKLVADVFRIGLRLRPNDDGIVTNEEVEKSIEEIISGPKSEDYKKNAMELKHAARQAVASGGSSDRNIQSFVNEILGNASESGETLAP